MTNRIKINTSLRASTNPGEVYKEVNNGMGN